MIWESSYWKDDLIKSRKKLDQWARINLNEQSLIAIEKTLMLGFYSIRKLIEAKKISTHIEAANIEVVEYPSVKNVTRMNWHKIQFLYDLEKPKQTGIKLINICNWFIHSYVFLIHQNEKGGLEGVYFNSDKNRNNKLFYISLKDIRLTFNYIGTNYPYESSMTFNKETMDYDVMSK